jgi:hypothetical protein
LSRVPATGGEGARGYLHRLEEGRVLFEKEILRIHRELRVTLARNILNASIMHDIITAPVIYSLIIPFSLLDLFVTVYQRICFPVYG